MNLISWSERTFCSTIHDSSVSAGIKCLTSWNCSPRDTHFMCYRMHLSYICRILRVLTSANFADQFRIEGMMFPDKFVLCLSTLTVGSLWTWLSNLLFLGVWKYSKANSSVSWRRSIPRNNLAYEVYERIGKFLLGMNWTQRFRWKRTERAKYANQSEVNGGWERNCRTKAVKVT